MTGHDEVRRSIAAQLLAQMIHTPGDKDEKVAAAVDYADRLLAELDKSAGRRLDERVMPHGRRNTRTTPR